MDDGKKAVGCGETWPLEAKGVVNYRSQTNRRVEILFYDPDELNKPLPCKDADCAEDDCHVFKNLDRYDPDKGSKEPRLAWRYIDMTPDGRLRVALRIKVEGQGAGKQVVIDGPEHHTGVTDDDGEVVFEGIQLGDYKIQTA